MYMHFCVFPVFFLFKVVARPDRTRSDRPAAQETLLKHMFWDATDF